MRHLKSYLPTHSVFHKFAAQYLCSFADAIRTKRAEAKQINADAVQNGLIDAIRTKRISNMLQSPMPGGWVQPPGIVLLAQQAFPLPPFRMKK